MILILEDNIYNELIGLLKRRMKKGAEKNIEKLIRIFLVRHGETEWNRLHRLQSRIDIPLNEEGKKQAHALALALKDEPLTAIYSSPLMRAMETARFIKGFHPSTPLFEEESLVEMDLGEFEGMEAKVLATKYQGFIKTWRSTPATLKMPGGESLQEVQMRAIDTVERINKLYPSGSTLLLCSHNFVNITILCHALGISLDRFREVQQDTAAFNILYMQGKLRVEVVNDISHLKKYKVVSLQT
jgi:probable phosphoglycerate mutase